jgi:hypothetical protein
MGKQLSLRIEVTTEFSAGDKDEPITMAALSKALKLELWVRIQLGTWMFVWVSSVLHCPV